MAFRVFKKTQEAQKVEKEYLTQYETKVRELHGMVIEGAKKAEAIREEKDGILLEAKEIANKKAELTEKIKELENQIEEAKKERYAEVTGRLDFIERTRRTFREQVDEIEKKKANLEEEIKSAYLKLEREKEQRIAEMQSTQEDAIRALRRVEEKSSELKRRNEELEDSIKQTQCALEKEVKQKTEDAEFLKETLDNEIKKLGERKNELQLKAEELNKQISSKGIVISTIEDVKRISLEAERKKEEITNELNKLEKQTEDLLAQKNKIEKESQDTKLRIKKEIKQEEEQAKYLKQEHEKTLQVFIEKRQRLLDKQAKLEYDIQSARQSLEDEKEKRLGFISATTKELAREQEKAREAKESLALFEGKIEELANVAKELSVFTEKEKDARERYLASKQEVDALEKQKQGLAEELESRQKHLIEKEKYLEAFGQRLKIATEKLNGYANVVKSNVNMLNEMAGVANLNVRFGLPPDQIIEVPYE